MVLKKEALDFLEISDSSYKTMIYSARGKNGKLKNTLDDKGRVDILEIANYVVKRRNGNKTTKDKAKKVILSFSKKDDEKKTQEKVAEDIDSLEEMGIEGALNRIQGIELKLYKKVEDSIDQSELCSDALHSWNQSLELLRKNQLATLEVLENKKILIRLDEVKKIYNEHITPIKNKFLSLKRPLSGLLEDQKSKYIYKILDEEFDKILNEIVEID